MKKFFALFLLISVTLQSGFPATNYRVIFSQSDSLSTLAFSEAQSGNYANAITYGKSNVNLIKKYVTGNHDILAKCHSELGLFYSLNNEWENAYKCAIAGANMMKDIYDGNNIYYALYLSDAIYYNARLGNISYAKRDIEKCVKITLMAQNEGLEQVSRILINQAYIYVLSEEYDQALGAIQKALAYMERSDSRNPSEYAKAMSIQAIATAKISKSQTESLKYANQALEIQDKVLPHYSHEKAVTLGRLSTIHLKNSKIEKALEFGNAALCIWDSLRMVPFEYEDCAWQMALLYNSDSKYEETLKLCNTLIKHTLQKQIYNPINYANMLSLSASATSGLNQSGDAVSYQQKSVSVIEKEKTKNHPSLISAYNNLAIYQLKNNDIKEALKTQNKSVKLSEKLYRNKVQHADALSKLASIQASSSDYISAISSQIKSNNILHEINPLDFELISGLNDLAAYQSRALMNEDAYSTELEVIKLYEENNVTNKNYATSLANCALYAYNCGQMTQAKDLQTRCLTVLKKFVPPTDEKCIEAFTVLVNYCLSCSDNIMACETQKEKVDAIGKIYTTHSIEYANVLDEYASMLALCGKYDEAAESENEAVILSQQFSGVSTEDYEKRLAKYYSAAGKHDEAEHITDLVINKSKQSEISIEYAQELTEAAARKHLAGNNADALRLSAMALDVLEQTDANGTDLHAKALNGHAGYYVMIHNDKDAAKYAKKAVDIYSALSDTVNLATSISNLAVIYSRLNENVMADSLCRKALELQSAYSGEESVEYARILSNVISTTFKPEKLDETIEKGNEVIRIYADNNMTNTLEYASALNNQSVYLLNADKDDDAISLLSQSLDIRKRILGKNHPSYLYALVNLCKTLSINGRKEELVKLASECTTSLTDMLRRQFMSLPANERSYYWNAWNSWFFSQMLQYAQEFPEPQMIISAYEGTIFAKGLMLNSECNLRDLIAEAGSEDIDNIYADLQSVRTTLNTIYDRMSEADNNAALIDSLEHKAAKLERQLINASKEYGDYTANLSVNLSDVKTKLGLNDGAIEFVSFNNGTETDYYAFILTACDTLPKFVRIATEKELVLSKHNSSKLSQLLWAPIASNLNDNINKLYFAPAGELYSLPMEYLPDIADANLNINDRWELHRLSSIRQLVRLKPSAAIGKAVIVGDIIFNPEKTVSPYDLPQTKIETENIYNLLAPKMPDIKMLTNVQGTEQTIRDLSGQGHNLFHIATHGFCISEEDADFQACDIFHTNLNIDKREEDVLKRSGLMLYGSALTFLGQGNPDRSQDGILTANEIAELDLRGLDLAVLSACQTALGDITGDGVFGLQRGFKKAGAKSLLLSLWKVDDTATQILMNRFYANLMSGMNKKDALTAAQQFLKNYTVPRPQYYDDNPIDGMETEQWIDHPYSAPDFWAAFILLDAID